MKSTPINFTHVSGVGVTCWVTDPQRAILLAGDPQIETINRMLTIKGTQVLSHLLHRVDGPAIDWDDDQYKEWWLDGIEYSFKDYLNELKPLISDEAYFILVLTYGDYVEEKF